MTHILVVDNYDSFVYTLNGYLHQLGATTDVIRNDDVTIDEVPALIARYDGILVSPGPGTPCRCWCLYCHRERGRGAVHPSAGCLLGAPGHC
jgi:anthranilate/para-aminobenzoate synthase component II